MRKAFTLQCALLRFCVALLLVASFTCDTSIMAITEVSGNEVNTDGKLVNEELAKTSQEGYDKEAKFKGFFSKPILKPITVVKPIPIPVGMSPKSIPTVKPIPKPINEEEKFKGLLPKPIPIIKPIPKFIPIVKPILKPIPVVKPIPIPVYKPITKSVPIVKPVPIVKSVPKLIPVVKPIPKPISKPIPTVEPESFLKPKPFFENHVPKLPLEPKFKKPRIPHFPVQKPIPTPTP